MDPVISTAVLLVALTAAVVMAAVRIVPAGSGAVVTRLGHVLKVSGSGLVTVVPVVDRVRVVSMQPSRMDPVYASAYTRDGFSVRLTVSMLWRLDDPARSLLAVPDPAAATADAVERVLHRTVTEFDLRNLLEDVDRALSGLAERTGAVSESWGVSVLDVDVLGVELRAGPELLRLLR